MENRKLSQARAKKRWTIAKVCELTGISEKTYRRCERGTHKPHYHTIDRLCSAFNMTAEDLGFVDETNDLPANGTDVVTLTRDQINAIIHILQLGEDEMTHFDPTRRKAILQALLTASSVAVASPQILANPEPWDRLPRSITQPLDMSKEALEYFQQLINIGWHLSNASQDATVERMLPIFIPQLEAAAQQPSKNQQALCAIVAQGYILASEVDRNNIKAVEHYGKLAVRYSETSHDYNILVAALKQQATIASIAHKTNEALEIYLKTLQYLPFVTPLLTSRVYMGLANTYAKSDIKNSSLATKYLDLAHETFPQKPEEDTSYLYTGTGTPVLYLYNGLTYTNLGKYQEAWDSLEHVDGIEPKPYLNESSRIEIINLQAEAAVGLGDLETSSKYLEAGITASKSNGYNIRASESFGVYQQIKQKWPNESSVKELIELFH